MRAGEGGALRQPDHIFQLTATRRSENCRSNKRTSIFLQNKVSRITITGDDLAHAIADSAKACLATAKAFNALCLGDIWSMMPRGRET